MRKNGDFLKIILLSQETYVKMTAELVRKPPQYKKLGKVKIEKQAALAVFSLLLLFIEV